MSRSEAMGMDACSRVRPPASKCNEATLAPFLQHRGNHRLCKNGTPTARKVEGGAWDDANRIGVREFVDRKRRVPVHDQPTMAPEPGGFVPQTLGTEGSSSRFKVLPA